MARRGRPPALDAELLGAIQAVIADLPTYGYRRVRALLRRQAERDGWPAPNVKRVGCVANPDAGRRRVSTATLSFFVRRGKSEAVSQQLVLLAHGPCTGKAEALAQP